MKKVVLTLITVVLAAGSSFAQMDKALVEAQKKSILDAIKKSDEAVIKSPDKARLWFDRGVAYLDLASFPDSSFANTDSVAAFKALDYLSEAINKDTQNGKKGSVAKDAEKLFVGREKVYGALMNMGVIKYQGKDYTASYRYMSRASEIAAQDTMSAMYTGVVAQLCQKDAEARSAYEKYMNIGGKDVAIIYGLAQIYKSAKEEDRALELIDQGIVLYPTNKDLRNEKFNMLISFNRIEQAIVQLKETVSKDPKDVMNLFNLGLLYENKINTLKDESLKISDASNKVIDARRKVTSHKDKAEVYIEELKRTKLKLKTAKPNLKPALQSQINKLEASIANDNVELNLLEGEYAEAVNAVGDEVANKAKIDELNGKIDALKQEIPSFYERALAIDPSYYDALYQLGAYYFNEGAEIKRLVNAMDMETYKKEGKAVEEKLAAKYQLALPYFERALSVKKDEDLKEIVRQVYLALKIDKQVD
jgi:Flp pilus assembly protein TadD